jgi:chemotaxis protein MotA
MNALLGLGMTVCMVFGGYMLAGGKMDIIMHSLPFEMMMIGGAAVGGFLAANDMSTIKHTISDIISVFKGPKWKKKDYEDLLCLMHELLSVLKKSPVAIEAHIEAPHESDIFARYPRILKDYHAVELICDTIRSMILIVCSPISCTARMRFKRLLTLCLRWALLPRFWASSKQWHPSINRQKF